MSLTTEGVAPINVLLVEDSPHYVRLLQETFNEVNSHIRFYVTTDGLEALAFLKCQGTIGFPRPDLILLDLNLPRMDGLTFLAKIKNDEDLKNIPTIVLTTSDALRDIADSYKYHANSYLQKPLRLEQLDRLVKSINDFWFLHSKLPEIMHN